MPFSSYRAATFALLAVSVFSVVFLLIFVTYQSAQRRTTRTSVFWPASPIGEDSSRGRRAKEATATSVGMAALLNEHAHTHRKICSGQLPLRAVVFYCSRHCYALADATRGILTAYALAVVTGRAFLIHSHTFLPVDQYFRLATGEVLPPGEDGVVDWRRKECPAAQSLLEYAESRSRDPAPLPLPGLLTPVMDLSLAADPQCSKILHLAASDSTSPHLMLLHTNHAQDCMLKMQFTDGANLGRSLGSFRTRENEPLLPTLFRRVFEFRSEVVDAVQVYIRGNSINMNRSICFHVRSGSFGLDIAAGFKGAVDLQGYVSCARDLERFLALKQWINGSIEEQSMTWVIVSDSTDTVKRIREEIPTTSQLHGRTRLLDTNTAAAGPIVHLIENNEPDNQVSEARRAAGITRVLFDLYLLSQCRYYIRGPSGFAHLGILLGGDVSSKVDLFVEKNVGSASGSSRPSGHTFQNPYCHFS